MPGLGPLESDTCRGYVVEVGRGWMERPLLEQFPVTDGRIIPNGRREPRGQIERTLPSSSVPYQERSELALAQGFDSTLHQALPEAFAAGRPAILNDTPTTVRVGSDSEPIETLLAGPVRA